MARCRKNDNLIGGTTSGMTLIEVVLILLVLGALALTVAVRMTSGTVNLGAAADSVSSHIRLVQTIAMNSSPGLWGICFESDDNSYYIFHCEDETDCDMEQGITPLPGVSDADGRIALPDSRIQIKKDCNVAFDDFGMPYEIKNNGHLKYTQKFTLTLNDGAGNSRDIYVTPETGFVY